MKPSPHLVHLRTKARPKYRSAKQIYIGKRTNALLVTDGVIRRCLRGKGVTLWTHLVTSSVRYWVGHCTQGENSAVAAIQMAADTVGHAIEPPTTNLASMVTVKLTNGRATSVPALILRKSEMLKLRSKRVDVFGSASKKESLS